MPAYSSTASSTSDATTSPCSVCNRTANSLQFGENPGAGDLELLFRDEVLGKQPIQSLQARRNALGARGGRWGMEMSEFGAESPTRDVLAASAPIAGMASTAWRRTSSFS